MDTETKMRAVWKSGEGKKHLVNELSSFWGTTVCGQPLTKYTHNNVELEDTTGLKGKNWCKTCIKKTRIIVRDANKDMKAAVIRKRR